MIYELLKRLERALRGLRRKKPPKPRVVWHYLAQRGCKKILLETPHGKSWVRPGDSAIGYHLFKDGEFEFLGFSTMLDILRSMDWHPRVFLDIGANIGTHTVYALRSGFFSSAVCFEPEGNNFSLLQDNIKENGFERCCTLVNAALGQEDGFAALDLSPDNDGDHRMRMEHGTVKVRTLDGVLEELCLRPMDCFLHMDVQGFEPFVLKGATHFLKEGNAIFTEFWPEQLHRNGDYEAFRKLVSDRFGYFVDVGRLNSDRLPIGELDSLAEQISEGIGTDILLIR